MILLLDLGNTNIDVGVYSQGQIIANFKTHSDKLKSESEYRGIIYRFLKDSNIEFTKIEGAILSSVVPLLTKKISKAVANLLNRECLVVSKNLRSGLKIQIDNPSELGADLLCLAVGANETYKSDTIVIDFGTCTKVIYASKDKAFKGCVIFPGIEVMAASLEQKAAQLYETDLYCTQKVLGKNTSDSICSGIINGTCYSVISFVNNIVKEYSLTDYKVIFSGGNAEVVKPLLLKEGYTYDPYLAFKGLYLIYKLNQGEKYASK